jgi:hypothetical protein
LAADLTFSFFALSDAASAASSMPLPRGNGPGVRRWGGEGGSDRGAARGSREENDPVCRSEIRAGLNSRARGSSGSGGAPPRRRGIIARDVTSESSRDTNAARSFGRGARVAMPQLGGVQTLLRFKI